MGDGSSSSTSAARLLMVGPPGSGKGTQCEKIVAHYANVQHFSAGACACFAAVAGALPHVCPLCAHRQSNSLLNSSILMKCRVLCSTQSRTDGVPKSNSS